MGVKREVMMTRFSREEAEAIRAKGMDVGEVLSQIERLRKGAPFRELVRPCTVGDGIRRLPEDQQRLYVEIYEQETCRKPMVKFVPASGAASRMFRILLEMRRKHRQIQRKVVEAAAREAPEGPAQDVLIFMDALQRFAFFGALQAAMARDGLDTVELQRRGDFTAILEYLLTGKGLDYAGLPKGLLAFHAYADGVRTAFEEQLYEGAGYARSAEGECRLHFTVSPEHLRGFENLLREVRPVCERRYGAHCSVEFSFQDPSTDTLAVDLENRPFRRGDGRLLFRPGGHGALIKNLSQIGAAVIFIKNIDNVAVDRLKGPTILWKKILAGCMSNVQRKIFGWIDTLEGAPAGKGLLDGAAAFVKDELGVEFPRTWASCGAEERRRMLLDWLDRPLRVCGMVRNVGAPGGGPFWVKDSRGRVTPQIIETTQVDLHAPGQRSIVESATHFNPVDLVCGILNRQGQPYDLSRFVDHEAVSISLKSRNGRDLKALEHPGLWNGGMAFWNTLFVEVPLVTFNPVKTVNDLLKDAHQ